MKNRKDQELNLEGQTTSVSCTDSKFQNILPQHVIKQTSLLALSLTATHSFATPAILNDTHSDSPTNVNFDKVIFPELMIIDSRLTNIDNLIERRRKGLIPIVVQQDENGLDAISQAMLKYPDASTIHVVSHGESGEILLGNSAINEDQLNTKTGSIHQWKNDKVLARPDLIVYGCNVAKGQIGQDFIKKLSVVTGFDVAASTNLTGQSSLGGDWELESNTGWIDASLAWQDTDIKQIQGVFAIFTVNNLDDSGNGSLRHALDNQVSDGDTINFDVNVTGTITLTTGELTIAHDIILTGPGAANLSINANGNSRVMTINNGLDVSISNLTITGGSASGNGGGIRSYASYLNISDSIITENFVSYYGGGISSYGSNGYDRKGFIGYNRSGSITITGSSITNNSASNSGGGIAIRLNNTTINDTTISGNNSRRGGGLSMSYGYSTISDTTISGNTANYGGGLITRYSFASIDDNSTISGNSARSGGGISSRYTFLNISDSSITSNNAYNGGGLLLGTNLTVINNTNISSNNAREGYGGGINSSSYGFTSLNITGGSINNNSASSYGGGIHIGNNNRRPRKSSTDNSTIKGLAPYISYSPGFHIDSVTINGNTSGGNGGGISIDFYSGLRKNQKGLNPYYSITSITNSTISNNRSYNRGGGLSLNSDYFNSSVISNSTISGNSSQRVGGGISLNNSNRREKNNKGQGVYNTQLDLVNSTVTNNFTNNDGGGIYNSGYMSLQNSIVANNTTESGNVDIYNDGGMVLDSSIIGDSNFYGNVIDNGGNILDQNPLLGPLQNNGGSTQTHLLTAGSPAIDAGDNSLVSVLNEQRGTGFTRILNDDVDMGATEDHAGIPLGDAVNAAFILSSIQVAETDGVVTYTINLNNPAPAGGAIIDLAFSGTADEGADYIPSGTQIVIPAGATSGSITFTIIDDGIEEIPDETIIIEIVGIINAAVSGPSIATVTILPPVIAGPAAPAIIPTLSSWATILLTLLVPAFVMRRFRKQKKVEITYS